MTEHTDQALRSWIEELGRSDRSLEELRAAVMALARVRDEKALCALERFREDPRSLGVERLAWAIEECTHHLLTPAGPVEEEDFIRVEIWQRYERELRELYAKLSGTQVRAQQLEVEKAFLVGLLDKVSHGEPRQAVLGRLAAMDREIALAESDAVALQFEIDGQEYLVEAIQEAIRSPFFRGYGRQHIGVDIQREGARYLEARGERLSPYSAR